MTIPCKAIDKIQDTNGKTIGYIVEDITRTIGCMSIDEIKERIRSGEVAFKNLKLTKDNKLRFKPDIT